VINVSSADGVNQVFDLAVLKKQSITLLCDQADYVKFPAVVFALQYQNNKIRNGKK